MAKPFSIRDLMTDDFGQQDSVYDVYEKVSVYDIGLNPKNEYTLSEIEKLKDSIYALGGVQQNIVLVKCPEWSQYKYLALDGHRRLMACRQLVNEGYTEFEYIPAVIKTDIDTDMKDAMLVLINSTQRNKSDWEKVMEHMRLKEIIPKLKKRQGVDGRTRDIEADLLGVSHAQINIYNTIGTRLNAKMMEMFKVGSIGISLAYETAKQELCIQEQIVELFHRNGSVTEDDIRNLAGSRGCKGQLKMAEPVSEKANVPESSTFEKVQDDPVIDVQAIKNVSESDTFKKSQMEPVSDIKPIKGNVLESDTFEKESKVMDRNKEYQFALRGGYELASIDKLIQKYEKYLNILKEDVLHNSDLISEHNCLLDALELLKEKYYKNNIIFS